MQDAPCRSQAVHFRRRLDVEKDFLVVPLDCKFEGDTRGRYRPARRDLKTQGASHRRSHCGEANAQGSWLPIGQDQDCVRRSQQDRGRDFEGTIALARDRVGPLEGDRPPHGQRGTASGKHELDLERRWGLGHADERRILDARKSRLGRRD